jgi:lipopolysaccharide heptosyltransferase II
MSYPENIAIALIGAIGDVILSTPLVEAIHRAYPGARITYMAGTKAAPALRYLPLIDDLVLLKDSPKSDGLSGIELFRHVRQQRFDLAVCLTRSDRLSLAFWAGRTGRRIGFTPLRTAWTLTDAIDAYGEPHTSGHRTGYFLAVATLLDLPHPDPIRLLFHISDRERETAHQMLRERGVHPEIDTLVAIHPGTSLISIEKRRWPAERFADVARHMVQSGRRVILLGGPDETELCRIIAGSLGKHVIDFSRQLDFREFAAILDQCSLLIHNDSSPLHLAGALGVPVIAIFGYQNPKHWGPLDRQSRVVRQELICSPCHQDFPCDRAFECIQKLPSTAVIEAAEALLESCPAIKTL